MLPGVSVRVKTRAVLWETTFQISQHKYSPSVFPFLINARTTGGLHKRNLLEGAGRNTFHGRRLLNSRAGTRAEVLSMVAAVSHNSQRSQVRT